MSVLFSEQGGEFPAVSSWLSESQLEALGKPEQDERLRACYAKWREAGKGDVSAHLREMLDIGGLVHMRRFFEETMDL